MDNFAQFCRRHQALWQDRGTNPRFWSDLWETIDEIYWRYATNEGVVVRALPETRDVAVQTDPRVYREVAVQTDSITYREVAAQTIPRNSGAVDIQISAGEVSISLGGAVTSLEQSAPMREGCWNCGGNHRYSSCPRPRGTFCYGCGEAGVTLKECRRCSLIYNRLDPSTSFRGPRDGSRPATFRSGPSMGSGPKKLGDDDED